MFLSVNNGSNSMRQNCGYLLSSTNNLFRGIGSNLSFTLTSTSPSQHSRLVITYLSLIWKPEQESVEYRPSFSSAFDELNRTSSLTYFMLFGTLKSKEKLKTNCYGDSLWIFILQEPHTQNISSFFTFAT